MYPASELYMPKRRKWLDNKPVHRSVLQIAGIAGLVNILLLFVLAHLLGGNAWNGHAIDGRYYLSDHGRITEVSHATFALSWWHTLSVFITQPLAMLSGVLYYE